MDNHFNGDVVSMLLGKDGYTYINTCRHDMLPKGTKSNNFNDKKDVMIDLCSRIAGFEQPIVVIKYVHHLAESGKESYCVVHCSFQSAGSTNITSINALPELHLYAREHTKGGGDCKGIELNEVR